MLYIHFLNLQNPLQDVEQLYKDGTIKPGDIVCQQYNDKYSHLFMNGTWVKSKYTSKIAQNTEVEDDVKTLYDSIANNSTNISNISTNITDISTKLSNYLTIEQYLKDEKLIARAFIDLDNRINAQTELLDNNSTNITDISTNITDISTNISNISTNISNISTNIADISTKLSDNYINKTQYLKDEELIASAFAELNNKIDSQNISIDNYINKTQYQNDKNKIDSSLEDLQHKIEQLSPNQQNYITTEQYLEDEELIASTFANVNNKINSLQAEIAELKEQLNNKA